MRSPISLIISRKASFAASSRSSLKAIVTWWVGVSARGRVKCRSLRKDLHFTLPRAETPTHHVTMAFNEDLDDAAKDALREMIKLIGERMGLPADDAYMFSSLAVDMRVTQLVDGNKGIHAMLPKRYCPS